MGFRNETFHHTCKKLGRPVVLTVRMATVKDDGGNEVERPVGIKRCTGCIDCGISVPGRHHYAMVNWDRCRMDLSDLVG